MRSGLHLTVCGLNYPDVYCLVLTDMQMCVRGLYPAVCCLVLTEMQLRVFVTSSLTQMCLAALQSMQITSA